MTLRLKINKKEAAPPRLVVEGWGWFSKQKCTSDAADLMWTREIDRLEIVRELS